MFVNFLLVLVLLALFSVRIYFGFFRAIPDISSETRARLESRYNVV